MPYTSNTYWYLGKHPKQHQAHAWAWVMGLLWHHSIPVQVMGSWGDDTFYLDFQQCIRRGVGPCREGLLSAKPVKQPVFCWPKWAQIRQPCPWRASGYVTRCVDATSGPGAPSACWLSSLQPQSNGKEWRNTEPSQISFTLTLHPFIQPLLHPMHSPIISLLHTSPPSPISFICSFTSCIHSFLFFLFFVHPSYLTWIAVRSYMLSPRFHGNTVVFCVTFTDSRVNQGNSLLFCLEDPGPHNSPPSEAASCCRRSRAALHLYLRLGR